MAVKLECPWCDYESINQSYPASSAMLKAHKDIQFHCRKNHQKETKQYQQIVNIWERKMFSQSIFEYYMQVIQYVFDEDYNGKPPRTIVNEYSPNDLKDKNKKELRQIIGRHVKQQNMN